MDTINDVTLLQPPRDQYMEQLGNERNGISTKSNHKKSKRKRGAAEGDRREDNETGLGGGYADSIGGDGSDSSGKLKQTRYFSVSQTASTHIRTGEKKPVGNKQAGTTPQPSRKRARRRSSRPVGAEGSPGSANPIGADISTECGILSSGIGDSGNNRVIKSEEKIIRRTGDTMPKKPIPPTKHTGTNPPNKKTPKASEFISETPINKKAGTQKSTFMTKKEAGLIFDMAIEGANWGNITNELNNTTLGAKILSKSLKRHFITVLKKQALSGYVD